MFLVRVYVYMSGTAEAVLQFNSFCQDWIVVSNRSSLFLVLALHETTLEVDIKRRCELC